jgi:hypothetical protein
VTFPEISCRNPAKADSSAAWYLRNDENRSLGRSACCRPAAGGDGAREAGARRDAKIAEEAFVYGLPLVMNDPGLYGTLKPWFNQTWKPDDIEPI